MYISPLKDIEEHDAGTVPAAEQRFRQRHFGDGGQRLGQVHPARQHHGPERGLRLLLLLLLRLHLPRRRRRRREGRRAPPQAVLLQQREEGPGEAARQATEGKAEEEEKRDREARGEAGWEKWVCDENTCKVKGQADYSLIPRITCERERDTKESEFYSGLNRNQVR